MHLTELTLYSPNIPEQSEFYSGVLGLNILRKDDRSVQLEFGKTLLNFEHRPDATPYHFAINIPSNKEHEALAWLKERVEILKDGPHEIQDFDNWNAKAVYFYDRDKNIVELIARKDLGNASIENFGPAHFLEVSEIGLPSTDIKDQYDLLKDRTGIGIYDGNFERFCAVGDQHGLFICINTDEKDWFPTNDKAFASDLKAKFIENGMEYRIAYQNEGLRII